MPLRECLEPGCRQPATSRKGRCDNHQRQYERQRSAARRGHSTTTRGPYTAVTTTRDQDPDYRYPRREA